jgi:hypothetical protein
MKKNVSPLLGLAAKSAGSRESSPLAGGYPRKEGFRRSGMFIV